MKLTYCELNEVCGGISFSMGSVNAQLVALSGLANSGAYLWGNIIRKQESTIAGFTGSMISGMAAGAVGVGIARVSNTATGAAAAALGGNYATTLGAAVEAAINRSVEAIADLDI